MKHLLCLILGVLTAFSPLCALADAPTDTPAPTNTPAPTATPTRSNPNNLPIGDLRGYRGGSDWFGKDFHYDVEREQACWDLLQRPIIVLNVGEKEVVYLLDAPNGKKVVDEWMGGYISGSLAGVKVLGEDVGGWTLIEGIDHYDRVIQGYVPSHLLKTVKPNDECGLIVDKLTQRLYVFVEGRLWSSCSVSTGLASKKQPYNETSTGEYLVGSWVGGFESEGMYCEMGIRFNGGDLINMVPYHLLADGTKDYTQFGQRLGRKASHGCVRVPPIANAEGLCISWLWDNLKRGTKVIVWDDDGRAVSYPDDSTPLYYNPDGGSNYHATANCTSVRERYLPLVGFSYDQLSEKRYAKLAPCPQCGPVKRKTVIDSFAQERLTVANLLGNVHAAPPPEDPDITIVIWD